MPKKLSCTFNKSYKIYQWISSLEDSMSSWDSYKQLLHKSYLHNVRIYLRPIIKLFVIVPLEALSCPYRKILSSKFFYETYKVKAFSSIVEYLVVISITFNFISRSKQKSLDPITANSSAFSMLFMPLYPATHIEWGSVPDVTELKQSKVLISAHEL